MSDDLTFIEKAMEGFVMPDEVDDYIDRWHDSDSEQELHDYLGMSVEEYSLLVEYPGSIDIIVAARRYNVPIREAVNDNINNSDRLAARANDGLALATLKRWIATQSDR